MDASNPFLTRYEQYLRSEHWLSFREAVLAARKRCQECSLGNAWSRFYYGQALNVHHLSYDRLGCELPEDVKVLCVRCHAIDHGIEPPKLYSKPKGTTWDQFCNKFRFPGTWSFPKEG